MTATGSFGPVSLPTSGSGVPRCCPPAPVAGAGARVRQVGLIGTWPMRDMSYAGRDLDALAARLAYNDLAAMDA